MNGAPEHKPALRRWLIRAMGSATILVLLFWYLPAEAILDGFSRVGLGLFLTVFIAFLFGHLLAALKWWLLLGRGFGPGLAIRAHFAGLASNLMLPGVAGGDAVRAAVAQRALNDGGRVVAGALADRLIDMLALGLLSLAGFLIVQGGVRDAGLALQVLGLLGALIFLTFFVAPLLAPWLWHRVPQLPAAGLINRISDTLRSLARRPLMLLGLLMISVFIQGSFVYLAVQFALAVGVDIPIAAWFFAWPLAKILAVLPVSLGGLGVREASLAALLLPFGAGATEVVASGLIWQGVLWLTGGLGAVVIAITGVGISSGNGQANNHQHSRH